VEQYFIERRLASFTVKSRRYVDFSGLGYHIPPRVGGQGVGGLQGLYGRPLCRLPEAAGCGCA
jgi:thymidylate synthase ThyX